MAQNHRFGVLVLAIALCLPHSVAEGREASSIGGFSLNMSSDEIASIARSRLRLKVVHSDDLLDLYNQGDDPDRSVPLAYFSYGEHGNIACMHFQIRIFKVENRLHERSSPNPSIALWCGAISTAQIARLSSVFSWSDEIR